MLSETDVAPMAISRWVGMGLGWKSLGRAMQLISTKVIFHLAAKKLLYNLNGSMLIMLRGAFLKKTRKKLVFWPNRRAPALPVSWSKKNGKNVNVYFAF